MNALNFAQKMECQKLLFDFFLLLVSQKLFPKNLDEKNFWKYIFKTEISSAFFSRSSN
jgi:hypothetical protein